MLAAVVYKLRFAIHAGRFLCAVHITCIHNLEIRQRISVECVHYVKTESSLIRIRVSFLIIINLARHTSR